MFRTIRCLPVLALSLMALAAHATEPGARLDRAALDALGAAAPEAEARVLLRWSSPAARRDGEAPQEIATVLRRIEVYAADARVLEATAGGLRELPRDRRLHFIGVGTVGQRFGLSLDPESGAAEGILLRDGKMFALQGAADAEGLWLDARDMDAPLADGDVAVGSCSGNLSPDAPAASPKAGGQPLADGISPGVGASIRGQVSFAPKVATRQATVAVDTDNNFLSRKFSNNTTSATNYIAALFTALNAIYEDDPAQYGLQLRLVQGTVILRPSTTADPFANADTSATGAALTEFGGWWRTNQVGVPRAFALLLSGNSSNQNSASGIAWLVTTGIYCDATGSGGQNFGHYSVNQVFHNPALPASQDAYLVAHELGHNLGARHTHCASAATGAQASTGTIDRCFSGESSFGCYAGVQACASGSESPVAPQGTLMSYCHLNGLGCGVSTEIHPTHVTQLNGRLASQPASCVSPLSTNQAPTITAPTGGFSAQEDTPLTLSGISFADPDAGGTSLSATFSIPSGNGALNAAAASGVTIGGSATARTLGGTLAALNGALSGGAVTYVPAANASGTVNLTITLVDGGTPQANDSEMRPINIAAVNDAPTLTLPGAPIAATEDVATPVAGVSFADVDAAGGSLVATFSAAAGSFAATGTPLVTVGGTPGARTLTGTLANLNGYLAGGALTYTGAANANGTVAITVAINDQGNSGGGAQSASGGASVQIAAVNDAPTVSAPASRSVNAGAAVAISPVVYADIDAPAGNIAVSAGYSAASGTFSATSGGGVTVSGSGTGSLTLSGQLSALNTFVAATPVQYTAAAAASGVVPVSVSINDLGGIGGGALSGSATVNVTVIAAGTIFVNGFED